MTGGTDAHTDNRRLRAEALRLRERISQLEAEIVRLEVVIEAKEAVNSSLRLACQTLEQARRDAA